MKAIVLSALSTVWDVTKVILKVAVAVTIGICAFAARCTFNYMCGGRR